MRASILPARLIRLERAHLPAATLLLSGVLAAGCTGGSGSPAKHVPGSPAPFSAVSGCLLPPASSCYAPRQFRVAYGIQPLLDSGIDGGGEAVTVLAPPQLPNVQGAQSSTVPVAQSSSAPAAQSSSAPAAPPPGASPATTDIRKDLAAFDRMFRLPAARIQVVTTLAGFASPWQASAQEVQDVEVVHTVAPAATLRVILLPANVLDSAATATADMIAALRLAVSGTDVASIGWSLGEHFFTTAQVAQMHSILRGAAAHHVTVAASSGDNGAVSEVLWRPAGQGGQPSRLRPARAGRRRHHAHREPRDRHLHQRDHLERRDGQLQCDPRSIGGRLQPPVPPSRLSRWRPRDLNEKGRA